MKRLTALLAAALLSGCRLPPPPEPHPDALRSVLTKVCLDGVLYYESLNNSGSMLGAPVYEVVEGAPRLIVCTKETLK